MLGTCQKAEHRELPADGHSSAQPRGCRAPLCTYTRADGQVCLLQKEGGQNRNPRSGPPLPSSLCLSYKREQPAAASTEPARICKCRLYCNGEKKKKGHCVRAANCIRDTGRRGRKCLTGSNKQEAAAFFPFLQGFESSKNNAEPDLAGPLAFRQLQHRAPCIQTGGFLCPARSKPVPREVTATCHGSPSLSVHVRGAGAGESELFCIAGRAGREQLRGLVAYSW